jgi:hypothetical protein
MGKKEQMQGEIKIDIKERKKNHGESKRGLKKDATKDRKLRCNGKTQVPRRKHGKKKETGSRKERDTSLP